MNRIIRPSKGGLFRLHLDGKRWAAILEEVMTVTFSGSFP